jgi:6-phosphofructokinase 1
VRDRDLDFTIARLGECRFPSPMSDVRFTRDHERVLYHAGLEDLQAWLGRGEDPPAMESAGPREMLFFDPPRLACGIVTCGGLCPGLNDVIRSIVLSLHHHYGVDKVYGFRFGYEGLVRRYGHEPLELTPDAVKRIHEIGGTVLGSSRGPQDPVEMVKTLEDLKIGILFAIGGDGTLRGAQAISDEAGRRGLEISVIGIPKTIDNDISFVQQTFGFETAVIEARRATYAANSEAEAARNGIGLVKLMGRDSGFIAAFSVLVDSQVNFCLVPEVPFTLERLLSELKRRIERRGHAVIVVAEGAGQDLMAPTRGLDASGNVRYGDIGVFLRDAIKEHFKRIGMEVSLKYIDPSYSIRSLPASPHDSAFCLLLGHCAVHAGMSGRTNMVVSFWNSQFTHVPISLAVSQRKKIDPDGPLWSVVLASTGQPRDMHGVVPAAGAPSAGPVRNR